MDIQAIKDLLEKFEYTEEFKFSREELECLVSSQPQAPNVAPLLAEIEDLKLDRDAWKSTAESFEDFYRKTEAELDEFKAHIADGSEVERLRGIINEWQTKWEAEAERTGLLLGQLAERDALLNDWYAANASGDVLVSDKAYRIVTRTAALYTNTEPNDKQNP